MISIQKVGIAGSLRTGALVNVLEKLDDGKTYHHESHVICMNPIHVESEFDDPAADKRSFADCFHHLKGVTAEKFGRVCTDGDAGPSGAVEPIDDPDVLVAVAHDNNGRGALEKILRETKSKELREKITTVLHQ